MPGMGVSADPIGEYFAGLTPYSVLGVKPAGAVAQVPAGNPTALASARGPGVFDTAAPLWSPENPLFWFGAVLAATFGLIGVSVAGRLGPARGSVNLGDAK